MISLGSSWAQVEINFPVGLWLYTTNLTTNDQNVNYHRQFQGKSRNYIECHVCHLNHFVPRNSWHDVLPLGRAANVE
jgi:hypothetical protein